MVYKIENQSFTATARPEVGFHQFNTGDPVKMNNDENTVTALGQISVRYSRRCFIRVSSDR